MAKTKIYKEKVKTIKTIIDDYETRNEISEIGNHDENISDAAIYARLKRARFKYNLNICKEAFLNIIAVSLIFVLIAIVYGKFFEISLYLQVALFSIPAIFFIFIIISALRDFKDKDEIVSIIDHKMGLKERLITSLEFAKSGKKSRLYNTLVKDAVSLLDDKRINESLNSGISKRNKIFVILAAILGIAAILLPHDQLLDKKPSDSNMFSSINNPVVSPSPAPETEAVKQEEDREKEKQNEVAEKKQGQDDDVKEKSKDVDSKPKVAQSEEEELKKDINDIMKRILSLLNNYSGSDDLEIDGDREDSQSNKLLAQADQNREQGGSVSKSGAPDGAKQEPETGDTDASKNDAEQGQKTANNLTAQNQQGSNKSNQSGNNGMNPPPGISGSPQNNTKGSGTDGTGSGRGGSSQITANTKGNKNQGKQKNDMNDRKSSETGSAARESVASAGNSTTDRTSKSSQTGMDKRGNKDDQSGQNNSDINTKSGKKGGTEDGRQVASGEKSAGKEHEVGENKIEGQDKNQSQAEKGVTSRAKGGSGSNSDNNEKISDSDTIKSGKDDKKTSSGGLGSSDRVAKLDKDVKSGDESGKDNSGKNGNGIGKGLQNVNANSTSTKELAKSGESNKNKDQVGKGANGQSDLNKADGKNKKGPGGQKVAQQNADTTRKDSSSGKSGSSGDKQKSKTNIAKDTRNIDQSMSGAKAPSSGKTKGKQSASKEKSGDEASGGETGKGGSTGTKLAQGGKQESQSGNKNGTKKDNLSKSSSSNKNGDIDVIKKDIANLLENVEIKIEDYEKKEKSQQNKGKQDIEVSDNSSQSDSQNADKAGQISANNQKLSNTGGKKSDDGQPGAGIGNQSANKLYSGKGENIDFDKGEEFEMFIEGEQDTNDSQKRDVESYGTKFETGEWEQPNVPIDVDAKLSRHQSKDDAIKNTQIPGEYEKIIKGIYLNDNN